MEKTAKLILEGNEYNLPIVEGTENEKAIDITSLRSETGYITLDSGYKNTGGTTSGYDGGDGVVVIRYPYEW